MSAGFQVVPPSVEFSPGLKAGVSLSGEGSYSPMSDAPRPAQLLCVVRTHEHKATGRRTR